MRWALENKRRLIPAFGYEKRGPAGERIKAGAKLAYIQRARGERERRAKRRERSKGEAESPRAQISNTHSLFSGVVGAHKHTRRERRGRARQIRNIQLLFRLSGTLNPKNPACSLGALAREKRLTD